MKEVLGISRIYKLSFYISIEKIWWHAGGCILPDLKITIVRRD
jgi:hypothetical protein